MTTPITTLLRVVVDDHRPGRGAAPSQTTLQPCGQARFLQVESLEHCPDHLVLDGALIALVDECVTLGLQHRAVQLGKGVVAPGVPVGIGHVLGITLLPLHAFLDERDGVRVEAVGRVRDEVVDHLIAGAVDDRLGA